MIVAASHIEVDLPIICFYKLSRKSHEMGGFVRSVFYYTAVKRLSSNLYAYLSLDYAGLDLRTLPYDRQSMKPYIITACSLNLWLDIFMTMLFSSITQKNELTILNGQL